MITLNLKSFSLNHCLNFGCSQPSSAYACFEFALYLKLFPRVNQTLSLLSNIIIIILFQTELSSQSQLTKTLSHRIHTSHHPSDLPA